MVHMEARLRWNNALVGKSCMGRVCCGLETLDRLFAQHAGQPAFEPYRAHWGRGTRNTIISPSEMHDFRTEFRF